MDMLTLCMYVPTAGVPSAWFHLVRQTNASQTWGMLFSSLRCSCRIDDFSCMSSISRVRDFGIMWTLVVQLYYKNKPSPGNHEFPIIGTAKDHKTWHLCTKKPSPNANHGSMWFKATVRTKNHGNCVIGTTVGLETMEIVLHVYPLRKDAMADCVIESNGQTKNHGNCVIGTNCRSGNQGNCVYMYTPQKGNHGKLCYRNNCQSGNHGNCVTCIPLRRETMATVL